MVERPFDSSTSPDLRWREVRCWWRYRTPNPAHVIMQQVSGPLGAQLLERLRRKARDAHLREIRIECLVSGRRRYVHLDNLIIDYPGGPVSDISNIWRSEDRFEQRRMKFLGDLGAACRIATRRGLIDRADSDFIRNLARRMIERRRPR